MRDARWSCITDAMRSRTEDQVDKKFAVRMIFFVKTTANTILVLGILAALLSPGLAQVHAIKFSDLDGKKVLPDGDVILVTVDTPARFIGVNDKGEEITENTLSTKVIRFVLRLSSSRMLKKAISGHKTADDNPDLPITTYRIVEGKGEDPGVNEVKGLFVGEVFADSFTQLRLSKGKEFGILDPKYKIVDTEENFKGGSVYTFTWMKD